MSEFFDAIDFNTLKPMLATLDNVGKIVPQWVEGQHFYVISDELLKLFIDEINEYRELKPPKIGEN